MTGGDGEVNIGSASAVNAFGTSLDYNLNALGHSSFTTDSPLSVPDYTDPPSAPGWVFEVIYELQVDGSLFAASGLGDVTVPLVHDSPNKIDKNKVYPEPDPEAELGGFRIIKFYDDDENGELDLGESLLAGWEFLVEGPDNFSQLVTTGPDGMVTLQDLPLGPYTITETVLDGWVVTTDNPQDAVVELGVLSTVSFGNVEDEGPPIPEPGTASLLLLGLLTARRRRRK